MDFAYDARTQELREQLNAFMDEHVYPVGTAEQKEKWLRPLASSDATNIEPSVVRDGDEYVINGRKWWITGAMNPDSKIFVVMGRTDPTADRHRHQSMILVPRDTPGVEVLRGMHVLGYDDHSHGGHAEIVFTDVRVPASNLIGEEGTGFANAQARLGPSRIHCMRSIGIAERAVELMCLRASERVEFGRSLSEQGVIREWIAESRKAIQTHGAGGLSQDFPLAEMQSGVRTLRFADGPDEVHLNALGRNEIKRHLEAARR
ncbi:acyl-CoA dehydrogenase family protein [Nonomuraea lactucae]|uniref:acyl-CoA dehydrogenase family protein n=1 Tax=Nonomuraea lactucae TaxID=2249762 RepID=UPI000DE47AD6|nr:acyl-CoA dehydrogenase family protein [Nonomuraea lactucae]